MDLHHVRAFLAVAEELHFGRAAQRLHMAQPPLSRTIQQLERHLGTRLFDRTTRTVRLTPQGEALLAPAHEIVRSFEQAERAVAFADKGETGRVRLAFAGPSSHALIGDLGRAVRRTYPGIELELSSVTFGSESVARLLDGSIDLAIARIGGPTPGLSSRVIQRERYVIATPPGHWLADLPEVRMEALAEEPWVALHASSGSLVREALLTRAREVGFVPRIVQQAPDSWTIMALVSAGVGVTLTVDTAFTGTEPEEVRVVPLAGPDPYTFASLAWRADDSSPALRRVIELSERVFPTPMPDEDVASTARSAGA